MRSEQEFPTKGEDQSRKNGVDCLNHCDDDLDVYCSIDVSNLYL